MVLEGVNLPPCLFVLVYVIVRAWTHMLVLGRDCVRKFDALQLTAGLCAYPVLEPGKFWGGLTWGTPDGAAQTFIHPLPSVRTLHWHLCTQHGSPPTLRCVHGPHAAEPSDLPRGRFRAQQDGESDNHCNRSQAEGAAVQVSSSWLW